MTARKKCALTPEEQLEAALVPESEWPYEVPENWCWTFLDHLYLVNPKVEALDDTNAAFVPMEKIEPGMTGRFTFEIQPWKKAKRGHTKFIDGDVAFAKISPCFENRKSMLISGLPNGIGAGTTELIILRNQHIVQRFTHLIVSDSRFINGGSSTFGGTVGQQRIDMAYVKSYPIALPPYAEQQRIVDVVERLFSKLDDAEAKLREVIASSEQRQAAILHSAFSGKLSESWRTTHNVNQDTWRVKRFDEVAYIRSNLVDPATFADYPHIAPDNIEKKTGTLLPYRTIGEDGVTSGKHHFYPGQILYSKIRPYLSKAVVVDFEGLCSADMYPIEAIEDTRYLWYYILSEDFLEQTYSAGSRTVLPKINQTGLSAIKVPIPTEAEQRFISETLDTYFESSREAESQVMEALQRIQSLRQTILAKALRGKLGTNDPDEPSSKELLAEILAE